MLILPIQEHWRYFIFWYLLQFLFSRVLNVLLCRSFPYLGRATSSYFVVFVAIVKGDVSLISDSAWWSFVYKRTPDFLFLVNLVLCHIITGVCLEFPGKILGSLMYTIISSLGWCLLDPHGFLFDVFLDYVCQYFIQYFCVNVHQEYWSLILFLSGVFGWFVY